MPVYSVCFTKSTTWNVYAKSKEEAEEAARILVAGSTKAGSRVRGANRFLCCSTRMSAIRM